MLVLDTVSHVSDAVADEHEATPLSSAAAQTAAGLMQGLASPVRVRILDLLRRAPSSVGDLADGLGLEHNAVSNHLRLLRHLSLVRRERRGRLVIYDLHDHHVDELLGHVLDHVAHLPAFEAAPARGDR